MEDSVPVKNINLSFKDSLKRTLQVNYKWKEKTNYIISIPKGTLTDIFGIKNDSLQLLFKTKASTDYGTLSLKIQLPNNEQQFIVQLIDDKENVFRQTIIQRDS